MRRAIVVAATLVIAAGAVAYAARDSAYERCELSAPPFPFRVVDVDVSWRPLSFGYRCVYTNRWGGEVTLAPCPEGLWRQPGLTRCGPRRPP